MVIESGARTVTKDGWRARAKNNWSHTELNNILVRKRGAQAEYCEIESIVTRWGIDCIIFLYLITRY